jgi:hypothetical protein
MKHNFSLSHSARQDQSHCNGAQVREWSFRVNDYYWVHRKAQPVKLCYGSFFYPIFVGQLVI